MNDRPKKLLEQSLADLRHARTHLDYSYTQVCQWENALEQLKEDELESVDAFTSRFARCLDLLVNKVLRSLDRYELKPGGTLLDVVNGAVKRGFLEDVNELRDMKDLRNIIAHDYAGHQLQKVFDYCKEKKPQFDNICQRLEAYVNHLLAT